MTITPKKKTSKTRTKQRTTNWIKLKAKKLLKSVFLKYLSSPKDLDLIFFKQKNSYINNHKIFIRILAKLLENIYHKKLNSIRSLADLSEKSASFYQKKIYF